ncbi:UDP-2,4-diacetamido-2,4,6-trideoxy-beta-L-altropyranose hydrolase [Legionella qingyii]|uniref:UDP-2,4-diacetamido-2,4, 6-trideoxy-beta-L-altropyranose hydrolase n=1 Tax=Legionella qingyii TaxID=2184757 RepID=A0A317U869_9GAMM|nr:UDP-2,4-diacetamido-2,4,6-trideoxy-beta-L-altropyranose hydrolase [Legionella qingyii]PWY56600.1 UDP-2,4-diacetamido-2,4,6-trideoxy-beta-L-altropyranose hydrolase [Legionella qingyii]RUR23413.1 UDP-2,4-diacetamido-2,4,6-trideoxy-beta-L-altropyranose hydrolase [Legionella qingyii]RUR26140.1 UDP-2,4-diacetamido-2,4,6-trideoxy-beta-L-altropyranose hydrolase [Legionella qingyii]
MNVAFRVDASLMIGNGHVMRCLTLANALRIHGHYCVFICADLPGNLISSIIQQDYKVHILPRQKDKNNSLTKQESNPSDYDAWLGCTWNLDAGQTAAAIKSSKIDWLVVDHYALDVSWEEVLKPFCKHLMVIDDLANRSHMCDLLLDQTLNRPNRDYSPWVPASCSLLTGTNFAIIRPEFAAIREYSLGRRSVAALNKILISMGGVDQFNVTEKILDLLLLTELPGSCQLGVVLGANAPFAASVHTKAKTLPWATEVLQGISTMEQLMAEADLAIGAAGSTSWERCCLGLPTIMVTLADNQKSIASELSAMGAAIDVGTPSASAFSKFFVQTFMDIMKDIALLNTISYRAQSLVDGYGVARVVRAMECNPNIS